MKRKVYYVVKVSQKGFKYVQLFVDLEYGKRVLSMDANLIAELARKPVCELYEKELNTENYIGEFVFNEVK